VFNSADFRVGARMWSSSARQEALRGHATHHTDDLAGSLGLSCVRSARRDVTEDRNTSDRGADEDHRNALDGKILQKTRGAGCGHSANCHMSHRCTKIASEPLIRGWRPIHWLKFVDKLYLTAIESRSNKKNSSHFHLISTPPRQCLAESSVCVFFIKILTPAQ
jgi:hypothetical protein